jgi:GNAT superfamily N-acetyltransferase
VSSCAVRQAGIADIDVLAGLFDLYRQFYAQSSDVEGARAFLSDRITRAESVIFLTEDEGKALGFCQLYPSFTSAGMARTYILNDLFVDTAARGAGVGRKLLEHAASWAKKEGAARLTLSTAHDNLAAQALYEACGWQQDAVFRTYHLPLRG